MLFEIGFQLVAQPLADNRGCDLMLFEIGFQSAKCAAMIGGGCDLMLFEIGFQYLTRLPISRHVVI